jgi:hypothetical protein
MEAATIRAVIRPIINLAFIGVTASSFFLNWVKVPQPWELITYICALEWVSERALKRFRELFGASAKGANSTANSKVVSS